MLDARPRGGSGTGRVCYLHVGTGKTGSSAIQYALTKAHEVLRKHDYLYPDVSNNFRSVIAREPTAGNAAKIFKALRDAGSARAIRLVEPYSFGRHHLVLSCEGFAALSGPRLAEFGAALRSLGYDTKCLVFFRPQAEKMASSYLQLTKSNKLKGSQSLEEYVARQLAPEALERRWNWYSRVILLERAFGDRSVTVKWYPSVVRAGPNGVVQSAFAWLGLPSLANGSDHLPGIVNPTPGREALIVLRAVNANNLGGKKFADEFLSRAYETGLLGSKVTLGQALSDSVEAATRSGNIALLRRYCPELSTEEVVRPLSSSTPMGQIDREKLSRLAGIALQALRARSWRFGVVRAHPRGVLERVFEQIVAAPEAWDAVERASDAHLDLNRVGP